MLSKFANAVELHLLPCSFSLCLLHFPFALIMYIERLFKQCDLPGCDRKKIIGAAHPGDSGKWKRLRAAVVDLPVAPELQGHCTK